MLRLTCGSGSASWFDFGAFWRQFDVGFDADWLVIVSTTVSLLGVAALGFGAVWAWATAVDGWRSRPVPQLDNPVLEGATRDLSQAVELMRSGVFDARTQDLVTQARVKIGRCGGRLTVEELRVLTVAWSVVESEREAPSPPSDR